MANIFRRLVRLGGWTSKRKKRIEEVFSLSLEILEQYNLSSSKFTLELIKHFCVVGL